MRRLLPPPPILGAGASARDVRPRLGRAASAVLILLGLLLAFPAEPAAHEVPTDVTVHAYVRPEGTTLRYLVRIPMEAVRDVEFPLRGPGYLDLEAAEPYLSDAARLWIADYVEFYEDRRRLPDPEIVATRVSLPSNRAFTSYEEALAHVTGPPLAVETQLYWEQGMLDVLLEYPIESARSRFSLRPELSHLGMRTTTVLRFVPPDGETRVFQYRGDPGRVELDPRWHHAALRFVESGFHHILGGIDHLLFLLCLIIPFRTFWGLVPVVTSFTVAHSITLLASALGMAPDALWFPPLIETLIALSIVYMAFENILGPQLEKRWLITFGFGLVHGFGFAFILRESLQFSGSHLLTSLLAFNVGVELGQLLVLLLVIPVLELLFRVGVPERMGAILLSALVAHEAWHWMTERGGTLGRYRFQLPAVDAAFWASTLRWMMVAVIAAGSVWLLHEVFGRWEKLTPGGVAAGGDE